MPRLRSLPDVVRHTAAPQTVPMPAARAPRAILVTERVLSPVTRTCSLTLAATFRKHFAR